MENIKPLAQKQPKRKNNRFITYIKSRFVRGFFIFITMNIYEELQKMQFPFPIKRQVAWGDMDAFNHINNVIYFRYFETGRVEFFNKTNLWELFVQENIRIVVAKLECNFINEIVHPAEIEILVGIKRIGNSSLTIHQIVKHNGAIAAHGEGIIVATNPETGKSKPWTDALRAEFSKWL